MTLQQEKKKVKYLLEKYDTFPLDQVLWLYSYYVPVYTFPKMTLFLWIFFSQAAEHLGNSS